MFLRRSPRATRFLMLLAAGMLTCSAVAGCAGWPQQQQPFDISMFPDGGVR